MKITLKHPMKLLGNIWPVGTTVRAASPVEIKRVFPGMERNDLSQQVAVRFPGVPHATIVHRQQLLLSVIFLLLSAACCFGQTSGNVITGYQALSLFGKTNSTHTNDLIALSIRQGTASERPKGILVNDFSNALFSSFGPATASLITMTLGLVKSPLTTNGPLGNPILVIGDSLSTDGSMLSGGLPGYLTVASGRGNDWPSLLLQNTNWYYHGPYLNIASNTATVSDMTNYYRVLGGDTFVSKYSNANPIVTILSGANAAPNDPTTFTAYTNALSSLFRNIRSNGGTVVAIGMWAASGASFAVLTNLTNAAIWQSTTPLVDVFIDSKVIITNATAGVQTIDGTHLDSTNNQNLANYIASRITPSRSKYFNTLNRAGDHFAARTMTADYAEFGGAMITGFRSGGRSIGLYLHSDNATYGWIRAVNEITTAELLLILGQTGSTILIYPKSLMFGTTGNDPIYTTISNNTAQSGSVFVSSDGTMYVRSNTAWRRVTTTP